MRKNDERPIHRTDVENDEAEDVFAPAFNLDLALKKMNDIIKIFRYSPLKIGILEKIQRKAGLNPLKFIIAVKIRWNSSVLSGKRFLELLPYTAEALKHRDIRSDILWNELDTETLKNICSVLGFRAGSCCNHESFKTVIEFARR